MISPNITPISSNTPLGSAYPVSPISRRSRSSSFSSDARSLAVSSALKTSILPAMPSVRTPPAYVALTAAAQLVTDDQRQRQRELSDPGDSDSNPSPEDDGARVSLPALALINGFLDNLLFTLLATARSTTLPVLRLAVDQLLKGKLAREAAAAADEELESLLAERESDVEDDEDAEPSSAALKKSEVEACWKRTRLRIMVYMRLSELHEEDEEDFVANEQIPEHLLTRSLVPWEAAIFLTSILEYVAELALNVAGRAAHDRVNNAGTKNSDRAHSRAASTGSFLDDDDRVLVEERDVEKLAVNSSIGRLWRTWKKQLRSARSARSLQRSSTSSPRADAPHKLSRALEEEFTREQKARADRMSIGSDVDGSFLFIAAATPLPAATTFDFSNTLPANMTRRHSAGGLRAADVSSTDEAPQADTAVTAATAATATAAIAAAAAAAAATTTSAADGAAADTSTAKNAHIDEENAQQNTLAEADTEEPREQQEQEQDQQSAATEKSFDDFVDVPEEQPTEPHPVPATRVRSSSAPFERPSPLAPVYAGAALFPAKHAADAATAEDGADAQLESAQAVKDASEVDQSLDTTGEKFVSETAAAKDTDPSASPHATERPGTAFSDWTEFTDIDDDSLTPDQRRLTLEAKRRSLAQAQLEAQAQAQAQAEAQAQAQAQTQTQTQTQAQAQTQTEAQTEAQTKAQTQTQAQAHPALIRATSQTSTASGADNPFTTPAVREDFKEERLAGAAPQTSASITDFGSRWAQVDSLVLGAMPADEAGPSPPPSATVAPTPAPTIPRKSIEHSYNPVSRYNTTSNTQAAKARETGAPLSAAVVAPLAATTVAVAAAAAAAELPAATSRRRQSSKDSNTAKTERPPPVSTVIPRTPVTPRHSPSGSASNPRPVGIVGYPEPPVPDPVPVQEVRSSTRPRDLSDPLRDGKSRNALIGGVRDTPGTSGSTGPIWQGSGPTVVRQSPNAPTPIATHAPPTSSRTIVSNIITSTPPQTKLAGVIPRAPPAPLNLTPSKRGGLQARDAVVRDPSTRDFADFIRSTAPSSANTRPVQVSTTPAAIPVAPVVIPSQPRNVNGSVRSGTSSTRLRPKSTLQPREPVISNKSMGSADLIAFLREENPPWLAASPAPTRNPLHSNSIDRADLSQITRTTAPAATPPPPPPPNRQQPSGVAPGRTQYRNKDPYAMDFIDDADEDEDDYNTSTYIARGSSQPMNGAGPAYSAPRTTSTNGISSAPITQYANGHRSPSSPSAAPVSPLTEQERGLASAASADSFATANSRSASHTQPSISALPSSAAKPSPLTAVSNSGGTVPRNNVSAGHSQQSYGNRGTFTKPSGTADLAEFFRTVEPPGNSPGRSTQFNAGVAAAAAASSYNSGYTPAAKTNKKGLFGRRG